MSLFRSGPSLGFDWLRRADEFQRPAAAVRLAEALAAAAQAHLGDFDHNDEPMLFHVMRVAAMLAAQRPWNESAVIVGLLHDATESGNAVVVRPETGYCSIRCADWPFDMLFHLKYDEVRALDLLRFQGHGTYKDYIRGLVSAPLALRVKLADLDDNLAGWRLRRVDRKTRERLQRKYIAARRYLTSVAQTTADFGMF